MRTPLSVGVIGLDVCGLAYADALCDLPNVRLRWLCGDLPARTASRFPDAALTTDPIELFADELLDAVVIASESTPALTWCALAADKHVLAAAPLTRSAREANDLMRLAQSRGLALLVSEPLVAQPAAARLRDLIGAGRLGDVYALYANAHGLPRPRRADGVWSFGVDQVALLLYLLGDEPIEVTANGESYIEPSIVDAAFCRLRFATGITAHLHLSWLDPVRTSRVTAIGSKRMAVLDQFEPERKLTLYQQSASEAMIGDIRSPRIDPADPLRSECQRLVTATRETGADPAARRAVAVVTVLEALNDCLEQERPDPRRLELRTRPDLHVVSLQSQA